MPGGSKERPISVPLERDAYADLLRDTRGLRREQAQAREAWLQRLDVPHKEDLLFELEILLKGLACFANPRNHPGPPRRTAVVAQDFRAPLVHAREAMGRVVDLCRALLDARDRAFVFQRYLETVLPDESSRTRLVRDSLTQTTPEDSLNVLRHGVTNLVEVASGMARLPRVPFRLFYSVLAIAQREIWQSIYFNPLSALEFRPEFDRITTPQVLELTRGVPGDLGRRVVALTFLSLFRMLRYLALLDAVTRDLGGRARRHGGAVFLVASVLRSDARALTTFLRQRAGAQLADGFEREVLRVSARQMPAQYEGLLAEGHRLIEIRATLEGIAANLRLELRRAFERDFPAPEDDPSFEALRASVHQATGVVRPAIQNAILVLGKSLGTRLDEHGVFDDLVARRTLGERLRRDVWMFAQIVRAFAEKGRAVPPAADARWTGASSFQFVREFLTYFRAMGYPLLRAADYPRFDAFLAAMAALEETDVIEPARLQQAIAESEQFYEFLTALFDRIGRRAELAAVPFDRRAAAEALKLYLGDR